MQKIGDIPNTRADSNGEFTDGNVAGGVPPTILPAEWFNTIQRELISILTAAGITPDSEKFDQIAVSISKLVSKGEFLKIKNNLSEIKAAGPAAVAEAQANLNLAELLGDALQKKNNLSEIAAAGSAAQAVAQANIGLTPSKFSGRLLNTQTFTSTGTYTPTAGTAYIEVEAVGGGGASGAVSATSASQNAIAATGSPGAYAKVLYTSVPSTASVVIGSGGIGALSSGQTGGSTTFGSILTCPGGPGSIIGAAHTPPGGSTGQGGASAPTVSVGGQIMVSAFGQQNNPAVTVSLGVGTNYVSVERTLLGNYGAAAPGQFSGQSQGNKSGFNGNNGYLIVREYS
ncbi:glycine-rich domain-containing protein [Yersinia enterocolitica]|uniref:glycine-rich domain-containing protein n=1 Tax=Yersinia enterocolitica TaxID=630 RepID=UPI0005DBF808|nr:hypothetical protein [Yersinia enterocolitica]CQJ35846.1 bacteriophage tail fiber protein [Yersinia enterocolitica]